MAEPKFKNLVYFIDDFDNQKNAVKYFGARVQSTLIACKGARRGSPSSRSCPRMVHYRSGKSQ
jgi:hypothetical protein